MRHSLEPKRRKHVEGYSFLSFANKMMDVGKKVATSKATKDFAKTVGKKVANKTAEATEDLVGRKVADKIASMKKGRAITEKEKRAQIIKDLCLFSV